jgi:hypothetical protein
LSWVLSKEQEFARRISRRNSMTWFSVRGDLVPQVTLGKSRTFVVLILTAGELLHTRNSE